MSITWRDEVRQMHMLYRIHDLAALVPVVDLDDNVTELCATMKRDGLITLNDDGDWATTDRGMQVMTRLLAMVERVQRLKIFEYVGYFEQPFDDDRNFDPNFDQGVEDPEDLRVAMFKHANPSGCAERYVFLVNLWEGIYDERDTITLGDLDDIQNIVDFATEVPKELRQLVWDAGMREQQKLEGPGCMQCDRPLVFARDETAQYGYAPCQHADCPLRGHPDDTDVVFEEVTEVVTYEPETYGYDPYAFLYFGLLGAAILID